MTQDFKIKLACSAGVLLVRANVKSSQSFIRPAMFDMQLEGTVGVEGGGSARRHLPEEAVQTLYALWVVAKFAFPEIGR